MPSTNTHSSLCDVIQHKWLSIPFNYILNSKAGRERENSNGQGENHRWCNHLSSELVGFFEVCSPQVSCQSNESGRMFLLNHRNVCLWIRKEEGEKKRFTVMTWSKKTRGRGEKKRRKIRNSNVYCEVIWMTENFFSTCRSFIKTISRSLSWRLIFFCPSAQRLFI